MQAYLPQISQAMGDIKITKFNDEIAKFELFTVKNGIQISHYVEFVRDQDGTWRLVFF